MRGTDEAKALHASHPAIDLHADTLLWARWLDYDLHRAHQPPLPLAALGGHVDVPRMLEGGVGAQFFGLVSLPWVERQHGLLRTVCEQLDAFDRAIGARPGVLVRARTAADVEAARRTGAIAALLGLEGAHTLEGDLDNLDVLVRRGLRYLGLLHFSANEAGAPAYGRGRDDARGLSPWGFELIERCEDRGVIVDLSHINKRGFLDACRVATKPMLVSHTGVLGAFEHWRNIDDEQLRAVADGGGCVGVIFCPRFLGSGGIEGVVKHLRYIVDVVGEDHAALGSDWDGFIVPTAGLEDPRGLPSLTDALLADGMSRDCVGKILRGNVMRVLAEA